MVKIAKQTITQCHFIHVQGSGNVSVMTSVFKGSSLAEAKEFSKKLWALVDKPYIVRILNQYSIEVFCHKK